MADTTHLQLPLLAAAQAQKHVTHNEALLKLDALVQLSVISRQATDPPLSPNDGDRYIPASGATGAWENSDLNVQWFVDGVWSKLVPRPGWRAWVEDEAALLVWNGAAWADIQGGVPTLQSFTEDGTWEKPAGLKALLVEIVGGGGAGGGAQATSSTQGSAGSGGGAGGYARLYLEAGDLGSTETVTIGAGGAPVSGDVGGDGGGSSFGAHAAVAGGKGGSIVNAGSGISTSPPAAGGAAAAAADVTFKGAAGGGGLRQGSSPPYGVGGIGGGSPLGGGGAGGARSVVFPANTEAEGGSGFGSGGGGAGNDNSQSARGGGAGAAGACLVWHFF